LRRLHLTLTLSLVLLGGLLIGVFLLLRHPREDHLFTVPDDGPFRVDIRYLYRGHSLIFTKTSTNAALISAIRGLEGQANNSSEESPFISRGRYLSSEPTFELDMVSLASGGRIGTLILVDGTAFKDRLGDWGSGFPAQGLFDLVRLFVVTSLLADHLQMLERLAAEVSAKQQQSFEIQALYYQIRSLVLEKDFPSPHAGQLTISQARQLIAWFQTKKRFFKPIPGPILRVQIDELAALQNHTVNPFSEE
jgi:hypothetical protein